MALALTPTYFWDAAIITEGKPQVIIKGLWTAKRPALSAITGLDYIWVMYFSFSVWSAVVYQVLDTSKDQSIYHLVHTQWYTCMYTRVHYTHTHTAIHTAHIPTHTFTHTCTHMDEWKEEGGEHLTTFVGNTLHLPLHSLMHLLALITLKRHEAIPLFFS